jgi:hypothetical protein
MEVMSSKEEKDIVRAFGSKYPVVLCGAVAHM